MTPRPTIWRTPSARANAAHEQRQRDRAAMRRLAEEYDRKQAERAADPAETA